MMADEVISRGYIEFLRTEAQSLHTRLKQVKPFSLTMPMVMAAAVSDQAMRGITNHIANGVTNLQDRVTKFIDDISSEDYVMQDPERIQARYAMLKLRFNAILDQFDIFADVLAQRAEHETGVWIAGLDVLAVDGLNLKGDYYEKPAIMCFLERGHGAAIRRARTRLPGGDDNPVSIIQVPRERMVGSGIASSLIHEVGHQGAALLELLETLRKALSQKEVENPETRVAWHLYRLWISEIISDFWAVATLGIAATLGLINVVSLPRYFMFRIKPDDPHPFPWIRVQISIAFGEFLFPGRQWSRLREMWEDIYPTHGLSQRQISMIAALRLVLPSFIELVCEHRPESLKGKALYEVFPVNERQPAMLRKYFSEWQQLPENIIKAPPCLVFAVMGQAKNDGLLQADNESWQIGKILSQWAFMHAENRTKKDSVSVTEKLKQFI